MRTRVASPTKEVIISPDGPTTIIGERINPAGKKSMAEALKSGNFDLIRQEAVAQVQAGADIIDVNVSLFGIDEVAILPRVISAVCEAIDAPICIDSNNADAVAAALKVCLGRPLVNSVTGEQRSLSRVLPLIKEYGTAVVGLVQNDNGLPKNAAERVAIARRIVEAAGKLGIPPDDIVIDPLAFAVGADPTSAQVAFETMCRVKQELGVNMVMGASNISFGMPDRGVINSAFVAIAIYSGLTSLIADTARIRPTVLAIDLLLEHDKHARRYVNDFRKRQGKQ